MSSNNNYKIKKTSQQIIKDPKNLQKLPQLIQLFKQNSSTATNGILWLERIFTHYNQKISFLTPIDTTSSNKAAIWMNKQYQTFENILLSIFYSSNITSLTHDSFKSLLNFAELQNNTNTFEQIIIILLFKSDLTNDMKSIFSNFIYNNKATNPTNTCIKTFTSICHLTSDKLITKYLSFIHSNANQNDDLSKLHSTFQWNTLHILLALSEICTRYKAPAFKKRKLETDTDATLSADYTKNRDNYLTISWLNYLGSSHLETKIYHLILTRLESDIFPVFKRSNTNNGNYRGNSRSNNNLILLSDFLTDSYNIGGEISLLSLKGLFILITQYNLDYPNFYDKLYQKLHSNIFYSKNATKFFELLSMFLLKSDYIPQYLMVAFVKRLSRMSLFAPPHAIIFVLNIITDLLRKYPSIRYLVDRSRRNNKGLMEAMRLHSEQKLKRDIEEINGCDYKQEQNEGEMDELIGNDPFDFNEMDPQKCNAKDSSLWELKTLINHFEYKTSGYAFETVTHFKDKNYKRIQMNRCHMFEYHKLLNYYFVKNEWFMKNAKIEKDKEMANDNRNKKYGRKKKDSDKKKKRYNVHELNLERSDHLFDKESLFGELFSI